MAVKSSVEVQLADEPAEQSPQAESVPVKNRISQTVVIAIIAALVAAGTVWYVKGVEASRQSKTSQAKIDDLTSQNVQLKKDKQRLEDDAKAKIVASTKPMTAVIALPVVNAALKTKLKDTLQSGNTAAIESNLAANVSYATAASGNVGTTDEVGAVKQLNYFKDSKTPWNFDIATSTLASYKTGSYKDYIADDVYFGVSADGMYVSFRTNSAGKIDQIFMAASVDLLK